MIQCNFCKEEVPKLEISHIIPKFIYKWLKETSTTKKMRSSQNPNKPEQDGYKVPFLCKTCENDFSRYEKYFSEKIFKPFIESNDLEIFKTIDYKKFQKFIISLIWRVAQHSVNEPSLNGNYTADEILKFNRFSNEIKHSYKKDLNISFNTYLIPLTEKFVSSKVLKVEDYVYFERSIAMEFMIFDNHDGQASVLIKLPFMMIVCEYISSSSNEWNGLKINQDSFEYSNNTYKIPTYIHDFMEFDKNRHYDIMKKVSETQLNKIKTKAKEITEEDGTYKAMHKNLQSGIL